MLHHPVEKKILRRSGDETSSLFSQFPPLLRRVYRGRNLLGDDDLDRSLARLPSPWLLSGMENMVACLAEAIERRHSLSIVADYDADGATSCALGVLGLRALGAAKVSYFVPNRFAHGYGLTPEIAELAAAHAPDALITVDNGISSLEGVRRAKSLGMKVLITDHHLPGEELPEADAIVNPNLPGDAFPSKALAGVGVMFYVLTALRARLRETGHFARARLAEPNLGQFLDLVALGTVADVVALDRVNRILAYHGLRRIRQGQARPGIAALLQVAGRKPESAVAADLGFSAAPRLNAAGRLEDMSLGIECLLAEERDRANAMALKLDEMNRERRDIEEQMKLDAFAILDGLEKTGKLRKRHGLCLFDASWHQGVIGILASRVKDRLHRPTVAFAPAGAGELKGSARSIPGLHIRDLLADIAAVHPQLLSRFGGHAMAAGLSIAETDFAAFADLFDAEARKRLQGLDLDQALHSDGELDCEDLRLENAELLQEAGPWGHGFPEPLFDGEFEVVQSRILKDRHLKLVLTDRERRRTVDGIAFFVDEPARWLGCRRLRLAYRLDVNEFRDNRGLQLRIEYMEGAEG